MSNADRQVSIWTPCNSPYSPDMMDTPIGCGVVSMSMSMSRCFRLSESISVSMFRGSGQWQAEDTDILQEVKILKLISQHCLLVFALLSLFVNTLAQWRSGNFSTVAAVVIRSRVTVTTCLCKCRLLSWPPPPLVVNVPT